MQTAIPTKLEIRESVFIELGKHIDKNSIPPDLKFKNDYIYKLEYFQYWNSAEYHSNYLAYVEDISNKQSPIVFSQIGLLSQQPL